MIGFYGTMSGLPKYNPRLPMGFEGGKRKGFKAMAPIGPHYRFLGDYAQLDGSVLEDPDTEQAAWPEVIDQTELPRWCGPRDFEDAEDDDADLCITDEHHDANEEDGI